MWNLERLSKLVLEVVEADERTAQGEEGLMDILAPFIPDRQPPIAVEPGQGALDHPAIPAQPLAGFPSLARDPNPDVAAGQRRPAARDVVGLVGVQRGGPFAGA